jgi:aspartate ammonia-lyase
VFRQAADKCIARISADPERCREHLERSMAQATMLVPRLGYDRVSALVKEAVKKDLTLREVMDKKKRG